MRRTIALAAAALVVVAPSVALADFTVWADETSTGYYRGDDGIIKPLTTTLFHDTTSTNANGPPNQRLDAEVPAFLLPAAIFGTITAGDLTVSEVEGANPPISDLIRFTSIMVDGNLTQAFLFYSDNQPSLTEPTPPASDVGVPKELQTPNFPVQEVGTEEVNSFTWTPGVSGSDIGMSTKGVIDYHFYSDGRVPVPEPSSLALCVLGAATSIGYALRRRRST
jgi:hypothetical protein